MKEIAGDQPVLLTGDFNVDQSSESYQGLVASGELTDAFEVAPIRYALNGTADAFNPHGITSSRIDHVFFSRHFKPQRYGVLTDTYRAPAARPVAETQSGNFPKEVKFREFQARLPSDHFPVLDRALTVDRDSSVTQSDEVRYSSSKLERGRKHEDGATRIPSPTSGRSRLSIERPWTFYVSAHEPCWSICFLASFLKHRGPVWSV